MIGIKEKFHSLSFLDNIPLNIIDGISSTASGKRVVHATSFLSLKDVLFIPKFLLVYYLSAKLLQNHCRVIFPIVCFSI